MAGSGMRWDGGTSEWVRCRERARAREMADGRAACLLACLLMMMLRIGWPVPRTRTMTMLLDGSAWDASQSKTCGCLFARHGTALHESTRRVASRPHPASEREERGGIGIGPSVGQASIEVMQSVCSTPKKRSSTLVDQALKTPKCLMRIFHATTDQRAAVGARAAFNVGSPGVPASFQLQTKSWGGI